MAGDFKYDVFLSHSAKDKAVVREVANRLKSDGVRVWFDEWEIKPGDRIPAKIDRGLEHSRVLVPAGRRARDWLHRRDTSAQRGQRATGSLICDFV